MLSHRVQLLNCADPRLKTGRLLAAETSVCTEEMTLSAASRLLGRSEPNRYHILFAINPETGRISRVITEQEMAEDIAGL